jgi:hypothetical protein
VSRQLRAVRLAQMLRRARSAAAFHSPDEEETSSTASSDDCEQCVALESHVVPDASRGDAVMVSERHSA